MKKKAIKTKVWHMWVPAFKKGKIIPRDQRKIHFECIGTVVGPSEAHPETCWELTNHSCWNHNKKKIMFEGYRYYPNCFDRGYTNDDIIVPYKGQYWAAKFLGFEPFKTFEEAKEYLRENADWVRENLRYD